MKIENLLLDCDELLIEANHTRLGELRRKELQNECLVKFAVLNSILRVAMTQRCIAFKTYEESTKLIDETCTYLHKWIASDELRMKQPKTSS